MSRKIYNPSVAESKWDAIERRAMRRLDKAHKMIPDNDRNGWIKFFEEETRRYQEEEAPVIKDAYKVLMKDVL